jgi:NAD(P)-dependent dehydrogenase (short-subunit alcohol dehydrogenase family)
VIRFLVSDDARFVTGATIPVDGGMAAQPAAAANWKRALDGR